MRIEIEIPKEFEQDYTGDKFVEFFGRVLADIKTGTLCGTYERETAEMFAKAFKESTLAYNAKARIEKLGDVSFERFGNSGMGGQKVVSLDDAIEIVQEDEETRLRICSIEAVLDNELYDSPAQKLAYEAELQFLRGNTNGYGEPTAWVDVENGETLEVSLESADGTLVMTIYDKEGNPTLPHYRGDTLDELFEGYFDDKEEERV